jgi:hypothetical protein
VRIAIFLVDDFVQIAAAVVPVLHVALHLVAAEQFHVDVVNDHRFDVGIALGADRVAGELGVGGRENRALGVVQIGILDERQIARAA